MIFRGAILRQALLLSPERGQRGFPPFLGSPAGSSAVWVGQAVDPGLLRKRNSSSNSAATCPSVRLSSQGMKAHILKCTAVNAQAHWKASWLFIFPPWMNNMTLERCCCLVFFFFFSVIWTTKEQLLRFCCCCLSLQEFVRWIFRPCSLKEKILLLKQLMSRHMMSQHRSVQGVPMHQHSRTCYAAIHHCSCF